MFLCFRCFSDRSTYSTRLPKYNIVLRRCPVFSKSLESHCASTAIRIPGSGIQVHIANNSGGNTGPVECCRHSGCAVDPSAGMPAAAGCPGQALLGDSIKRIARGIIRVRENHLRPQVGPCRNRRRRCSPGAGRCGSIRCACLVRDRKTF